MSDVVTNLQAITDGQVRAMGFVTPAVLESVEVVDGEPLGVLHLLESADLTVDKIPIWTHYAGDEYGYEQALHPPERGLLVCMDVPLEEVKRDEEPPAGEGLQRGRHHEPQDALFLPGVRKESEAGLDSPLEADWFRHITETERRFTEEGDWEVEHFAGHYIYLREDEVVVEFERSDGVSDTLTLTEDALDGVFERSGGGEVSLTLTEDELAAVFNTGGETVSLTLTEEGVTIEGGELDMQGESVRNGPLPSYEGDPDPTISDPDDPAFYPGDAVEPGYFYKDVSAQTFKMWGFDDAPHEVTLA